MIEFLLVMGGIWLLLFLGQPLVAYMDAMHACDLKYATDRRRRTEVYEELSALHQQSEMYQRMKEEKKKKYPNKKPSPNNAKARRARRRKPLQEAYAEKQRRLADERNQRAGSVEVLE